MITLNNEPNAIAAATLRIEALPLPLAQQSSRFPFLLVQYLMDSAVSLPADCHHPKMKKKKKTIETFFIKNQRVPHVPLFPEDNNRRRGRTLSLPPRFLQNKNKRPK